MSEPIVQTVELTPNYEVTALYFAEVLRDHGFEKGSREPVHSLIQQIRYLMQTDPEAVHRILTRLA